MEKVFITKALPCAGGLCVPEAEAARYNVDATVVYTDGNTDYVVLAGNKFNICDFLMDNFSEDDYDFNKIIADATVVEV